MKIHLYLLLFVSMIYWGCKPEGEVMTVRGEIIPADLGKTLVHEHLLVDFIGADSTGYHRWDRSEAADHVLPYLLEIKSRGYQTLVDCTPAYIGRDPQLLKTLSEKSGLNILTNTGYYGAVDSKFIPQHAYVESAQQLAERWIREWEEGIDNTGIKPGFMKIGVNPDSLSPLHRKIVETACITHLATGLTIASHTGPALPAFQQMEILEEFGISPEAFVWVHAQNEKDGNLHIAAAGMGAWISLDGVGENNIDEYVHMISNLKNAGFLHKVLISHDAGWYSPGEENGGDFRPFTTISDMLGPSLTKAGFSQADLDQLLVDNPETALSIQVRRKE